MRKLDIPHIFKSEAEDIKKSRDDAIRIHGTADIKAAGNEIEIHIRDFFRRMLPKNLYITHGHLIDRDGFVSPQMDIIISDTTNLPSLMKTKDGTEYIPIDSVYACGEIKSSYYKNKKYIESFSEILSKIKKEMAHDEILNTAFNGKLDDDTIMRDIFLCKGNKTLNKIYFFMLFVNGGDFSFKDIKSYFRLKELSNLPNLTVIMDKGVILYGKLNESGFIYDKYPDEVSDMNSTWYFNPLIPRIENSSLEGNNLGFLYYSLIQHISNSYLEPPDISKYLLSMMSGSRSAIESSNK